MTAEVVIANKLGVALAADSMVSIGDKTLDSANKLFALSKYHPVGVLVYNTMNMTTVPMEILIKGYRGRLDKSGHKTLVEYSKEFIEYLTNETPFGVEEERDNVGNIITDICMKLNEAVSDKCDDAYIDIDDINDGHEVRKILQDQIDKLDARVTKAGTYSGFTSLDDAAIDTTYMDLIRAQARRRFRRYKLSARRTTSIATLISKVLKSALLSRDYTGIVVAGYGNEEHYPSVLPFRTDGFIVGKLKIIDDDEGVISHQNKSLIYPFAQSDVIELFVEGISDPYQRYIVSSVNEIFAELAGTTAKYFGISDARKVGRLKSKLLDRPRGQI